MKAKIQGYYFSYPIIFFHLIRIVKSEMFNVDWRISCGFFFSR